MFNQLTLANPLEPTLNSLGCGAAVTHSSGVALLVDAAEQRVVRQFVEALLFEHLVPYESAPRRLGTAWNFEPIYDLEVEFRVGPAQFRCVAALKAFSRVRVAQGSVTLVVEGVGHEARLTDFLTALPVEDDAKLRLRDELGQTVDLSRWNYQHLTHQHKPRRGLSFQELESAIVEGHLYHPSFKSRTGFSLQDHQDYGSEAGNRFQLQWLAASRRYLRIALPCEEAVFWQGELGTEAYASLSKQLESLGGTWQEYALVPVHPWQLCAIQDSELRQAIANQELILLGAAGDYYHASQSLRTLVNASRPEKANVKLPLSIVCTSAERTLEPHFVCSAPALSQWLVSLVNADPFLQTNQHLLLLQEYAGLLYEPEAESGASEERRQQVEDIQGLLGTIYRESINSKLQPGESAVPFTAMMLLESDNRPFIDGWLTTYGTEQWVNRLIDVMLIPIWHMLVHHGIAFEAHAQNLVLVHTQGWPEKIVLRDFHEDTEFVPNYLAFPEQVPDFALVDPFFETIPDDDGYRMASTDALRELFMDTVYVYNLADLSFLLERFCSFSEDRFWGAVRKHLLAYAQSGVTPQARIDRLASESAKIIVESLLKKKILDGGVLDYFEHTIENTLRK